MILTDYIIQVNKTSVPVKKERWINLKQYYMGMYRFYMLKLCDLGYLTNPTILDMQEMRKILLDYGISDFKDICGTVCLTSEFACFALCRARGRNADEEDIEFLDCLYNALKYYEYCINLDKQYELNNKAVKLRLGLTTGSKVSSLTDVTINSGVLNLLVQENEHVIEASFSEDIFDLAMETLGIPRSDYCDGMFVSGLLLSEEKYFARLILDGEVNIDGKYKDILMKWLSENKWSEGTYKNANSKGLYSSTFGVNDKQVYELFYKYYDEYKDVFVSIVEDKIYLKAPINNYKIPVSPFCVLTTTQVEDKVITEWSSLYGYCGECYSLKYIKHMGYNYVGVPIRINQDGLEQEVYDVSQLLRNVEINTWFSQDGIDYTFEVDIPEKIKNNPYEEGTTEWHLYNAYTEGICGEIYSFSCEGGLQEIIEKRKEVVKHLSRVEGWYIQQ